jgi:hypothetical protein
MRQREKGVVATMQGEERGVTGHGLLPWSVCKRGRKNKRKKVWVYG